MPVDVGPSPAGLMKVALAALLKKTEIWAMAPPMRSTCGITSQPVVHRRVPSGFRSGTALMCIRAPESSMGPADSEVPQAHRLRRGQNAVFLLTRSSAASIAARRPAKRGLAAPSSWTRVVQQLDTPPRGAGLTTSPPASGPRDAHSERLGRRK